MTDQIQSITYELDAENRITRVSGPWDQFVRSNLGPNGEGRDLLAGLVIGSFLDEFIHDDTTRMYLNVALQGARHLKKTRIIDYRCDAPEQKRFMRMLIEPLDHNGLRLTHKMMRTEPLTPAFSFVPADSNEMASGLRCSLCNRVNVNRVWLEPDDIVISKMDQPFKVEYTLCPVCQDTLSD